MKCQWTACDHDALPDPVGRFAVGENEFDVFLCDKHRAVMLEGQLLGISTVPPKT